VRSTPLPTREDSILFFRVSVLSPARIGKNDPSGPVQGPVSLFPVISNRPVRGVFARSLTGNPAIGPVCLSGGFASEKTGLFRACLNRGSGGEMRFGLWRGVIRGPAVAMGVLAGLGVLRRRILRIQSKNFVLRRLLSSHVSSLMTFDKRDFSNPSASGLMTLKHSPASGLLTLSIIILVVRINHSHVGEMMGSNLFIGSSPSSDDGG